MNAAKLIHKAKLYYYLSPSKNRKYFEYNYRKHLDYMLEVLDTFKMYDSFIIRCGVWLYVSGLGKDFISKNFDKGRIYNMYIDSSLSYKNAVRNNDAVMLLLIDRIAHINYFIEHNEKEAYNAFQKHYYSIFKPQLYIKSNQCVALWEWLDMFMLKDWDSLMTNDEQINIK